MTYQQSFDLAMRLKDFVRLYDNKAWIYFIFTSETEFYLRIFDREPSGEVVMDIQYELFYVSKLPMGCVLWSDHETTETFSFRDQNLQLIIDLKNGDILYFDTEENTPIDMEKVRKSFSQLVAKLK